MNDWKPIETAPKDRPIRLLTRFGDTEMEVTGWWAGDHVSFWTSGGMSCFHAEGWMEPDLKDGLRYALQIVMESDTPNVDSLEQRNRIANSILKALGRDAYLPEDLQ